jgi:hypothetical protein
VKLRLLQQGYRGKRNRSGGLGRPFSEHRIQIITNPFGLLSERHIRHIMYAVQCALLIGLERSKQGIKVIRPRSRSRDEFEGPSQGRI